MPVQYEISLSTKRRAVKYHKLKQLQEKHVEWLLKRLRYGCISFFNWKKKNKVVIGQVGFYRSLPDGFLFETRMRRTWCYCCFQNYILSHLNLRGKVRTVFLRLLKSSHPSKEDLLAPQISERGRFLRTFPTLDNKYIC